jgi:hypothetical protein
MSKRPARAKRATPARQNAEENESEKQKRRQKSKEAKQQKPST